MIEGVIFSAPIYFNGAGLTNAISVDLVGAETVVIAIQSALSNGLDYADIGGVQTKIFPDETYYFTYTAFPILGAVTLFPVFAVFVLIDCGTLILRTELEVQQEEEQDRLGIDAPSIVSNERHKSDTNP